MPRGVVNENQSDVGQEDSGEVKEGVFGVRGEVLERFRHHGRVSGSGDKDHQRLP